MLVSEVAISAGAAVGGVWLWEQGRTGWAAAAFAVGALCVLTVVGTALGEKKRLRELAGPLAMAVLATAWLGGLSWGVWRLYAEYGAGAAIAAGVVGLWVAPLALAVGRRR